MYDKKIIITFQRACEPCWVKACEGQAMDDIKGFELKKVSIVHFGQEIIYNNERNNRGKNYLSSQN